MPFSQAVYQEKFADYLEKQINTPESKRLANKFRGDGFCYGFALCRAAMRANGKLAEWNQLLELVGKWDLDPNNLKQEIHLENNSLINPPVTLEKVFEHMTSLVGFHFASSTVFPHLEGLEQRSFLSPYGLFEVVVGDEIKKIQSNYVMFGRFGEEDLATVLDDAKSKIEGNICLISNKEHACDLNYIDGAWHFYDPNYKKGQAKIFTDTKELAKEIKRVLGKDIDIELASFNKQDLKIQAYEDLLANSPEKLLKGESLYQVFRNYSSLPATQQENIKKFLRSEKGAEIREHIFWLAVKGGKTGLVKLMHEQGSEVNSKDNNNNSALFSAAKNGSLDIVKYLVEQGAEVDTRNTSGVTPLMIASYNGKLEVVKFLVNNGADIYAQETQYNATALRFATRNEHLDVVKFLFDKANENGDRPDVNFLLQTAVTYERIDVMKFLMNESLPKTDNIDFNALLSIAVDKGNNEIIDYLIENYIDHINKDEQLITAVKKDRWDVAEMLMRKGANVSSEIKDDPNVIQLQEALNEEKLLQEKINKQIDAIPQQADVIEKLGKKEDAETARELKDNLEKKSEEFFQKTFEGKKTAVPLFKDECDKLFNEANLSLGKHRVLKIAFNNIKSFLNKIIPFKFAKLAVKDTQSVKTFSKQRNALLESIQQTENISTPQQPENKTQETPSSSPAKR